MDIFFELAERAVEAPKSPERERSEFVFCTNFWLSKGQKCLFFAKCKAMKDAISISSALFWLS